MQEIPQYFTKVVSSLKRKRTELADIFFEKKISTMISCEDHRIENINTGIDIGVGLRMIHNQKTSYAYANDISEPSLKRMAESLTCTINAPQERISLDMRLVMPADTYTVLKPFDIAGLDFKSGLVRRADNAARAIDAKIRQVKVTYAESIQDIYLINSEGEMIEEWRPSLIFIVQVVAAKGRTIQTGFEAIGGRIGMELFDDPQMPENIAIRAAQRALAMLDAAPAPTGPMTVVISSEAGGTMIHEAIGHGLEADLVQKGVSVFSNRLGEKVASPVITVIDDATIPGKRGSFCFDDEGTPAQKTVLVEKGMLKGYMYDRLTAIKAKTASTGNGRRQSYQHVPIPRMTNTFIAPGFSPPDEIIASTSEGLFVKKMGGGQVDTVSGDFVFEVNEGYLIRKGKVTTPVRGATLIGNGPKILQDIDMIGNDLGYQIGTCGKDGQAAPVSDAQPTLRIKQIVVGGQDIVK
ncbi:TldD/PmbA family protein [bacterium]|nr:TldD/PmbA family protein [bacterium]